MDDLRLLRSAQLFWGVSDAAPLSGLAVVADAPGHARGVSDAKRIVEGSLRVCLKGEFL
ncbi:MAG: hypothetical protein GX635_02340 [Synergistaceae bacterium]|nr:hypothetical protein [Synergistaceae bacterium]